jgi:hypothetical protein
LDQEIAQLDKVKSEFEREKNLANEAERKLAEAEKRLAENAVVRIEPLVPNQEPSTSSTSAIAKNGENPESSIFGGKIAAFDCKKCEKIKAKVLNFFLYIINYKINQNSKEKYFFIFCNK